MNDNSRIGLLGVLVLTLDQLTKLFIIRFMDGRDDLTVIPGFFRLVHWGNTGAAWSLFHGSNGRLALVALAALVALILARRHFDSHTTGGQVALGLILGGIAGNLLDRIRLGHVTDFLYFYVERRGLSPGHPYYEAGFPAFNLADTAICCGVGVMFLMSLQTEERAQNSPSPSP